MKEEVRPEDTSRYRAFELWMNAPNPMVTLVRTFDVMVPVRLSVKKQKKFNEMMAQCH